MRKFLCILTVALMVLGSAHAAYAAAPSVDYSKYAVRNNVLMFGDVAVEIPDLDDPENVDPTPQTVESGRVTPEALASGAVHYWSTLTQQTEGAESSKTYTALLFSQEGKLIFALPLEEMGDCQSVIPSPSGEFLLVGGGNPIRPEITYSLYALGDTTPKASFLGVRGAGVEWIDPYRVAITVMDVDVQRAETAVNALLGAGYSVVVYDASLWFETMIKAATDTQSFFFESVDKENGTMKLKEVSVSTPADWNDEDKPKDKIIEVEVPAHG